MRLPVLSVHHTPHLHPTMVAVDLAAALVAAVAAVQADRHEAEAEVNLI